MENAGGWLESTSRDSEGPSSRAGCSGWRSERLNIRLEALVASLGDLRDGPRTKAADVGKVS